MHFLRHFHSVEISEEDMVKASNVIEVVDKLLPQCPKRHKVTFLISKADFFTRKALSKAFFNDEEQGRKHLQTGALFIVGALQHINTASSVKVVLQKAQNVIY